jgi:hypothetical protein
MILIIRIAGCGSRAVVEKLRLALLPLASSNAG